MKVRLWFKVLWGSATLFNTIALVWFLLGTTANFQRSLDLESTVILIFIWLPTLLFTIVSIVALLKKWIPSNYIVCAGIFVAMVFFISYSVFLFQHVNTEGWLTEWVTSDSLKTTSDKKYEYRIDLINVYQRNSHARLYVRDISTGKKMNIAIGIHTNKIEALGCIENIDWVIMEQADVPGQYNLHTTKHLHIPEEKFEIDVRKGTSKRIE